MRWFVARVGTIAAALIVVSAAAAHAGVSISAPTTSHLGSVPTGSATVSAQLGTVTVTASGLVPPSFVATVTSTDFTSGAGTAHETIAEGAISYWSGPATAQSGLASNTPGQLTALEAEDLSSSRTAFSGTGVSLSISASWAPTIIVNVPGAAVAGTYSGTITHSVA